MSASLDPVFRLLAVRNLLIDQFTAEIVGTFAEEGIESLVLKGPALAEWLYPGEVRPYSDTDLMVAPGDWDQAVTVLNRLDFSDYLGPMAHPRMESRAGTAFVRGQDAVDLHCTLHGLFGDPRAVWESFAAGGHVQQIGGARLRVPNRAALLLHVGLHVAHDANGKTLEDLRRAVATADDALWQEALALADAHDGVAAFASGVRLVPEGVELARRLGIETVRSSIHEVRSDQVPTAEGVHALLAPGLGARARAAMVASEVFPRPEFMRWWSPLARRGRLGLIASYPCRWGWLAINAPRGLLAVWRQRRPRR